MPATLGVWMSHGDAVSQAPDGFAVTATTADTPIAAFENVDRRLAGVQYHPEVVHSQFGQEVLRRFLHDVAGIAPDWTPAEILHEQVAAIRAVVGTEKVICGLSGGVDSAVAAALVHRAVGDQLTCVFVDHGLLRAGEREQVERDYVAATGINLVTVDASERFLAALAGVTRPGDQTQDHRPGVHPGLRGCGRGHQRGGGRGPVPGPGHPVPGRRRVRRRHRHGDHQVAPQRRRAAGRPQVRAGRAAAHAVQGRGAAARAPNSGCPPTSSSGTRSRARVSASGSSARSTADRLEVLRAADAIVRPEMTAAGVDAQIWQCPVVLLADVRSVGVQGDGRTYGHPIVLRPVSSEDAMTADWSRLPYELLAKISNRITGEVPEVNRVVLDVTSKPPGTIEWE